MGKDGRVTAKIYLRGDDYDLLLLHHSHQFADALRLAVRKHLTNSPRMTISSPEYKRMANKPARVSVGLNKETDADIIEFLQTIPTGNISSVLRILIRHAMAKPDIRQWMSETDNLHKKSRTLDKKKSPEKKPDNKLAERTLPSPPQPAPLPPKSPAPAFELKPVIELGEETEEDIFGMI